MSSYEITCVATSRCLYSVYKVRYSVGKPRLVFYDGEEGRFIALDGKPMSRTLIYELDALFEARGEFAEKTYELYEGSKFPAALSYARGCVSLQETFAWQWY